MMIWVLILYGVALLLLWTLTFFTLKGVDWILISGINTLPKEDREKYKEKHNMIEMNRYAGKRIFLPFAIFALIFAPLVLSVTVLNAEWLGTTWYGTAYGAFIAAFGIGAAISAFLALSKISGSKFEIRK